MAIKDRGGAYENFENVQEELVFSILEELLESPQYRDDVCDCEICFIDMAALALNALPPKYVADRFNMFPTGPDEVRVMRHTAEEIVRHSLERVAKRPRHEP